MHRALTYSLMAFAAVAAGAVGYATTQSLRPTSRAELALPRLPSAAIPKEAFAYFPLPWNDEHRQAGTSALLIRSQGGELRAFYIPTLGGKPTVPVSHPWITGLACAKFEPSFVTKDIACRDERSLESWVMKHRWSLEGRNLSGSAADLIPVEGSEEHGEFILHKPASAA